MAEVENQNQNKRNPNQYSPLYLHPSDGSTTVSVEKLQGVTDYRGWRRSMEIALSAKRKLGSVTGAVKKEENDEARAEMWNTCNDMVIAWILGSVSESIKKSVMYFTSACEIWKHLERRYLITNGARKFQQNKNVYDVKQNNMSVNEYYTYMQGMWEELDSLNVWPVLSVVSEEMQNFLDVLNKQRDEQKLFQFLTGLNDTYNPQRSHILMMTPLPSVEVVCSMIQQEESQREVSMNEKNDVEISAMFSKGNEVCKACGMKGHAEDRCWTVVGYPRWHPKHKPNGGNLNEYRGRDGGNKHNGRYPKGNQNRYGRTQHFGSGNRVAANAQGDFDAQSLSSCGTSVSAQQLEQLLKLLPGSSK
ncbi:unnamed protein product [Amaranthus hypochondriacus]